jgi:hypothetical protein
MLVSTTGQPSAATAAVALEPASAGGPSSSLQGSCCS